MSRSKFSGALVPAVSSSRRAELEFARLDEIACEFEPYFGAPVHAVSFPGAVDRSTIEVDCRLAVIALPGEPGECEVDGSVAWLRLPEVHVVAVAFIAAACAVGLAERLREQKLIGARGWGIDQSRAQRGDCGIGLVRLQILFPYGGPVLCQCRSASCEGAEQEECDQKEYGCTAQKNGEGDRVAQDQTPRCDLDRFGFSNHDEE